MPDEPGRNGGKGRRVDVCPTCGRPFDGEFVSVRTASALLGCSERTLRYWASRGRIPDAYQALGEGTKWRVPLEWVSERVYVQRWEAARMSAYGPEEEDDAAGR